MIYPSEYALLKELADLPNNEMQERPADSALVRKLVGDGFITSYWCRRPTVNSPAFTWIKLTELGRDALSRHVEVQQQKQKVQKEHEHATRKRMRKERFEFFMHLLGVLGFFIAVINGWDAIASFFGKCARWVASLF